MTPSRWLRLLGLGLVGGGLGYTVARARRRRHELRVMPLAGEMLMDVEVAPIDPEPTTPIDRAFTNPEEPRCNDAHAKS
jgi:hypothetical protein